MRGAPLLAALGILAFGASAAAEVSMDDVRARLTPELGSPEVPAESAYRHTTGFLPGTWVTLSWRTVDGFEDEHLALQCARSRLVISGNLTVSLERLTGTRRVSVPGRIAPWSGRLVSLEFDERAFVTEYLGIREEEVNEAIGESTRRGARRLMILTPRTPDILVGYDAIGGADPTIFLRCPPETPR
jgi:hypothetical protein